MPGKGDFLRWRRGVVVSFAALTEDTARNSHQLKRKKYNIGKRMEIHE